MRIKFWGVRGSIPTPLTAQEVSDKIIDMIWKSRTLDIDRSPEAELNKKQKNRIEKFLSGIPIYQRGTIGGNTPCVQVLPSDEKTIILDAGSGIRGLGNELMNGSFKTGEGETHLFFSHTHWDHISGLPFFAPIFVPGNNMNFYSGHPGLEERLKNLHLPWHFPVPWEALPAKKKFFSMKKGEPLKIGSTTIRCFPMFHPGGSYSYRFDDDDGTSFIYASDVEFKKTEYKEYHDYFDFFRKADAIIFDSMYTLTETLTKQDWGHSSAMIGIDLAMEAGVKKLIMFHHEPNNSDADLKQIFDKTENYRRIIDPEGRFLKLHIAYEGLVLELGDLR
ncbi:MAG: MBL fold metallo-hydrolase [FCB group bacterium]|nr:MBL fold metallo-hydrolase [FCB group bacterium]